MCVHACNLSPALLAEGLGYFTRYCGSTGVEWLPTYESAWKVNHGEEFLQMGLEPAIMSLALYH